MDSPFTRRLPPLTETYSFDRLRPCDFEPLPTATIPNPHGSTPGCPYRKECEQTSALRPLVGAFGSHIRVALVEPSANLIIRSEQQIHPKERFRTSLRRHIFESVSGLSPFCHLNSDTEHQATQIIGREVGEFCDKQGLAPQKSLIIDAILTAVNEIIKQLKASSSGNPPPLRWHELEADCRPYLTLVSIVSKQLSVVLHPIGRAADAPALSPILYDRVRNVLKNILTRPLACKPIAESDKLGTYLGFVDVRPPYARSPIAVAVLRPPRSLRRDPFARMILGEYGAFFGGPSFPASVFSMHDETTSGAKCTQACTFMALALLADRGARIESALEITLGANGLAPDAPDCTTHEQIVLAGLTQDQVVDAINRNNGSAVAFRRSLALDIPTNNIWFERLLAAYIHARYPVIIFVDAQAWKGRAPARKGTDSVQPAVGSKEHLHAVAAVGYLRAPNQACSMRSVIVHDPSHQPYSVVPLSHLVQSARAAAYDNHRHPCDIPAVFAAPELIKHHANELLERIAELPSGRPYVLDSYRDKDREFFVRLARGSDLANIAAPRSTDEQSFNRFLKTGVVLNRRQELRERTRHDIEAWIRTYKLAERLCWFVVGTEAGRLTRIWAMAADEPSPPSPPGVSGRFVRPRVFPWS